MGLREGHGVTMAPVTPAVAFAFLSDPRNAPEWFAPVTLAPDEPTRLSASRSPGGAASLTRADALWRFIPHAPARRKRASARPAAAIPMRMAAYEPPTRFVWETTYPTTRDNLRWEITCADAPMPGADSADGARPSAENFVAEPDNMITGADMASRQRASAARTSVSMTLGIQPGPFGWVSLLVAAPFTRGDLNRRAQRALDRACETLTARAELAAQPRPPRARSAENRRREKRKQPR